MISKNLSTLLGIAMVAACINHPVAENPPKASPSPSPSVPDAGQPRSSVEALEVCSRLRVLGCEEGADVDGGASCEDAWKSYGGIADLPAACVLLAASKADVRKCGGGDYFTCP